MKYVIYQRVSTQRQSQHYGLEAQDAEIQQYLKANPDSEVLATYSEVMSGANPDRPKFKEAVALCQKTGAKLLCSKLDRLSRSLSQLILLQESNIEFVITSMPFADRFSISILACVAAKEREMISQRTAAGLAVARSKGVILGAPRESLAIARKKALGAVQAKKKAFAEGAIKSIRGLQSTGILSLNKLAEYMTKRGEPLPRGKGKWTAKTVSRVLKTVGG
jgi:DNA invertase Pin-like site-specific DNA recombinase